MKSVTSFFNTTLFKKNLSRYWPIWALYAVIWLYALPMQCVMIASRNYSWSNEPLTARAQAFFNQIPDMLEGFGIFMAATFGVLAAMAVFSYLYNARAASLFHTLPVRREGLFLTSYFSGLVFLLAPNALVWLLTLGAESLCLGSMNLYTISLWLAGQSSMCLFFYSFAVLCAMFTGNLLALPAFYGILNFLAAILMLLFDVLFEPFLYGYAGMTSTTEEIVWWLTPTIRLADKLRWRNHDFGYYLEGIPELIVYAIVGLLFAGFALMIYRKRHIESAGDVVAVAVVRPIFKYGVALCSGLCLGYWLYALFGIRAPFGLTGSLLLWTAIGYFAAEMLLKKSFRVFKAWKGCAVLLALAAIGLASLHMDAFGFVARVPAANTVVSVTADGMGSYPVDNGRNFEFTTTDPDLIERTVALHKAIVDAYGGSEPATVKNKEYIRLNVTYTLSNGATIRRHYGTYVWPGSTMEQAARDFYCSPDVAKLSYQLDAIDPEQLTNLDVSGLWNAGTRESEYFVLDEHTPAQNRQTALLAVYNAVAADFAEGHLGKRYLFDLEDARQTNTCTTDLTLYWREPPVSESAITGKVGVLSYVDDYSRIRSVSITLTPNAHNTIRALTELGALDKNTTLRLYGDSVDEENRAKLIYSMPEINFNPNSADTGMIGGADGPTSIIVAETE